jgi:hypothetical protein
MRGASQGPVKPALCFPFPRDRLAVYDLRFAHIQVHREFPSQPVNQNIQVMTVPIYQMRHDMGGMNHNLHQVAGPMNTMGNMFPF